MTRLTRTRTLPRVSINRPRCGRGRTLPVAAPTPARRRPAATAATTNCGTASARGVRTLPVDGHHDGEQVGEFVDDKRLQPRLFFGDPGWGVPWSGGVLPEKLPALELDPVGRRDLLRRQPIPQAPHRGKGREGCQERRRVSGASVQPAMIMSLQRNLRYEPAEVVLRVPHIKAPPKSVSASPQLRTNRFPQPASLPRLLRSMALFGNFPPPFDAFEMCSRYRMDSSSRRLQQWSETQRQLDGSRSSQTRSTATPVRRPRARPPEYLLKRAKSLFR